MPIAIFLFCNFYTLTVKVYYEVSLFLGRP